MAEIPQVVILTKIDEFSPEIAEDLKNVYRLKSLKNKVSLVSTIKNYEYYDFDTQKRCPQHRASGA